MIAVPGRPKYTALVNNLLLMRYFIRRKYSSKIIGCSSLFSDLPILSKKTMYCSETVLEVTHLIATKMLLSQQGF